LGIGELRNEDARKVDVRLPGKGSSKSHGARLGFRAEGLASGPCGTSADPSRDAIPIGTISPSSGEGIICVGVQGFGDLGMFVRPFCRYSSPKVDKIIKIDF